jgi:hypothetical protein
VGGVDGRLLEELDRAVGSWWAHLQTTNERTSSLVRPVLSSVITECRCAVAKIRHERVAKEGADAAKRRQSQLEVVRECHERDGREMDSGGKQPPLDY